MLRKIIKELKKPFNLFIISICLIALFVRVYRIDHLLGFYYDQGRDALVIWNFFHEGKLFLIGPTTGIEGIFRGPWFYWMIMPFYFLGKGDPFYPSVFLSLTTVIAGFLVFKIGEKVGGKASGVLALIISSTSFYLVLASRWLSNPTPMLIISVLIIYSLFLILEGKKKIWIFLSFLLGMAMQFGSAAEVFYFPAIAIFIIWTYFKKKGNKNILPSLKIIIISLVVFLISFLPQIAFDVRHNGILRNAVFDFLFAEGSFKLSIWKVAEIRLPFYFEVFSSKIFPTHKNFSYLFFYIVLGILFIKRKILFRNEKFVLIFIVFLAPLIGMLFFQGNYGNVYDYYFTGYYLIFVLLLSLILGSVWKSFLGKILIVLFLALFLKENIVSVRNYIISGVDGETTVALGNQIQAVDYIYEDSNQTDFNVDVYVPPVIPHTYEYLFKWRAKQIYNDRLPKADQVQLLYTLYEVDPGHPERLDAWLKRQEGIGKVEYSNRFGGIVVERRVRINQ